MASPFSANESVEVGVEAAAVESIKPVVGAGVVSATGAGVDQSVATGFVSSGLDSGVAGDVAGVSSGIISVWLMPVNFSR